MPRYFFDLHNQMDAIDDDGVELADLEAAKKRAIEETREMASVSVAERGRIDLRHHVRIRDDAGHIVGIVLFEDALTLKREGAAQGRT